MDKKNILIIILLVIFLILATTVGYSLVLNSQAPNNKNIPINKTSNDTNNTTNITNIQNNQNNKNNNPNASTNNNVPTTSNDNKEESPYQTPDGKPRTSHSQSGYSDMRQSLNSYSDYVDREGKYDPWTMSKYETADGNTLYFNKK